MRPLCYHAVFIGLSMGFVAFCVDVTLETLNNWKFGAVAGVVRDRGGFWLPYLTQLAFCMGYSGLSGAIVSYLAPMAAGSGIPEIKSYLNGVHIKGGILLFLMWSQSQHAVSRLAK